MVYEFGGFCADYFALDFSYRMREVGQCRQLELVGRLRPVFECPAWFDNSTFRGVLKFDVLVYRMRF